MAEKMLYTPQEVRELDANQPMVIIDIRDKELFAKSHIPGAVNIPEIFYYLSTSTPEGLAELHKEYSELFSALIPGSATLSFSRWIQRRGRQLH